MASKLALAHPAFDSTPLPFLLKQMEIALRGPLHLRLIAMPLLAAPNQLKLFEIASLPYESLVVRDLSTPRTGDLLSLGLLL